MPGQNGWWNISTRTKADLNDGAARLGARLSAHLVAWVRLVILIRRIPSGGAPGSVPF